MTDSPAVAPATPHTAAEPGEPVAPLLIPAPGGGSEARGPVGSAVCPAGQQPVVDPTGGGVTCR